MSFLSIREAQTIPVYHFRLFNNSRSHFQRIWNRAICRTQFPIFTKENYTLQRESSRRKKNCFFLDISFQSSTWIWRKFPIFLSHITREKSLRNKPLFPEFPTTFPPRLFLSSGSSTRISNIFLSERNLLHVAWELLFPAFPEFFLPSDISFGSTACWCASGNGLETNSRSTPTSLERKDEAFHRRKHPLAK